MEINKIYNGDCLEVLKTFPDNSIDSCVTDPPYGISFMNKHWDYQIPSVEIWKEVFRVLKPGAHLLCACGTRTQHRMAVNVEDSGFEIRDVITWHYGQGFPKSFNINENLKKNICECTKVANQQEAKYNVRDLQKGNLPTTAQDKGTIKSLLQSGLSEHGQQSVWPKPNEGEQDGKKSSVEGRGNNVQKEGELQEHKIRESDRLDNPDGEKGRVHNGTQTDNGENVPEIIDEIRSSSPCRSQPDKQQHEEFGIIPNQLDTQENGTWENCDRCGKPILPDGIGTALKPATEFWTLARKPIEENTVAENVLKYGTGGLNIDGSRIESNREDTRHGGGKSFAESNGFDQSLKYDLPSGRFPANVIFDEFTGKILDEQTGDLGKSAGGNSTAIKGVCYNDFEHKKPDGIPCGFGDSGGASRFFYCPKSDNFERNKGLKGFDEKTKSHITTQNFENALTGSGNQRNILHKNNHPTVKPIDLMCYLVKLITPKRGICIDPFCGSGTTLIGCKLELINYIGIDLNEEYCKIAEARVAAWNPPKYLEQTLF